MKIAFLGTGLMGEPMALRLLAAGMPMIAYNRTPEKLATLQKAGAEIADAPAAAIRASDYVVLMLSDAPAIAETLFSDITKSELKGKTVISMSTISPSQSRALCDAAVAAGGEYLEAPVLGSTPEAKAGTLTVMVGATEAQYQRCLPILRYFGQEPRLLGEVGAASATKLALNQLIASLTTAFSLSLGLLQSSGVSVEEFMQILRPSALYAPTFDKKLVRMVERNYANPNFPTKHLLKDVKLFLDEARTVGLQGASLAGVQSILEAVMAKGLADLDYSSLYEAVHPLK